VDAAGILMEGPDGCPRLRIGAPVAEIGRKDIRAQKPAIERARESGRTAGQDICGEITEGPYEG
jgi:hypothetical protein